MLWVPSMDQSKHNQFQQLQEVQALLEAELSIQIETPEMDLIESGVLDSLVLVELIMLLDARYGIAVDINELEFDDFRNVQNLCLFIDRHAA